MTCCAQIDAAILATALRDRPTATISWQGAHYRLLEPDGGEHVGWAGAGFDTVVEVTG